MPLKSLRCANDMLRGVNPPIHSGCKDCREAELRGCLVPNQLASPSPHPGSGAELSRKERASPENPNSTMPLRPLPGPRVHPRPPVPTPSWAPPQLTTSGVISLTLACLLDPGLHPPSLGPKSVALGLGLAMWHPG